VNRVAKTPAEKPGWKTTEFWLATVAMFVGTLQASGAFADESGLAKALAVAAMALASLGYSVARGKVKAAEA